MTPEQWTRLERFIAVKPPSVEELEAEEVVKHRTRPRRGQGFGLSAEDRRAVEEYAMKKATEYLEAHWGVVTDVSGNSSFDLHCRRDSDDLRVEVKGTTTAGEEIILTRNEVKESRHPGYALFLVSEISLGRDESGSSVARGGVCRYFPSWSANDRDLVPISYRCSLDLSEGQIID